MIPVKHIDPDDLALYAMQLLAPEEMEEMGLHLQHSAEARRVLSEIYGDLSILSFTADQHAPESHTRQRLMKGVAREKKAIPIDSLQAGAYAPRDSAHLFEEPAKRSVAARVLPWVGWALAAGMVLPVVNFYQQSEQLRTTVAGKSRQLEDARSSTEQAVSLMQAVQDPTAVRVALTSTGATPPPEGRAVYVPDKGSLVFLASNLEKLQAYKTYELWLIPKDGKSPIPAGIFRPDERGNASVVLPALPKGVEAAAFGVTVEDGDGSQKPTAPILLKGSAA